MYKNSSPKQVKFDEKSLITKIWNNLPTHILSLENLSTFENPIKLWNSVTCYCTLRGKCPIRSIFRSVFSTCFPCLTLFTCLTLYTFHFSRGNYYAKPLRSKDLASWIFVVCTHANTLLQVLN